MKLSTLKKKDTPAQRQHNAKCATAARAQYERELTYEQVIAIAYSRAIANQDTVIGIPITD